MSNPLEQEPAREQLNEAEQFELINSIGNHEAKLLTTAIITLNPGQSFIAGQLHKELISRQGSDVQWQLHDEIAFKYCQNSLEPIGAVAKSTFDGRRGPITAFAATEFGTESGLPFAGALLDWSLMYPDISLQKVFGPTATTGMTRSPSTRYLLYSALLTGDSDGVAYTDIADTLVDYDIDKKVLDSQLRTLDDLKVVSVESKMVDYNPTVRILNPEFWHIGIKFDDLQPSTKLFYQALKEFTRSGKYETDLNTFIATCQSLDPSVSLPKIRRLFTFAVSDKTANFLSNVELVDRGVTGEDRTRVTITDDYKLALEDLCNRLEDIKSGQKLAAYKRRAQEIVNNPVDFASLMAKAKRFSAGVKGQEAGGAVLQQKVKGILDIVGPLTVRQVTERLDDLMIKTTVTILKPCALPLMRSPKPNELPSAKLFPTPVRKLR